MKRLDVAVAGCGPCGLATALCLHRDGHRVTLFDRFEVPRPIGSGLLLQPTGLAVLDGLGLGSAARANSARIDRLHGRSAGSGRTVLDVGYSALGPGLCGYGIHRSVLFDILYHAVRSAGIPVMAGQAVVAATQSPASLSLDDGTNFSNFDLVVDALGARSPLAPDIGRDLAYGALWATVDLPPDMDLPAQALSQCYRRASIMIGVLPLGAPPGCTSKAALFWSIRDDRYEDWRRAGIDAWKSQVRALWPAVDPLLAQIATPDQLSLARYAHRTTRRPVENRLIHIGDAWHSTSPQLGQGANMALLDAHALALCLRNSDCIDSALRDAVRMRRTQVRIYQALSLIFTPFYQSDSSALPALRDFLVGRVGKLWPMDWIQAAMVAGLIGAPLKRLGLEAPFEPDAAIEPQAAMLANIL